MTMEHNTSIDKLSNPVGMLDELSDVDSILNEFLLGAHSQLSTHVKMSGYLNDTVTPTKQIELSSTFSSKDSSCPNTSEIFDSVVNEPVCTFTDMASDTNHQKVSLNDGPCDALPGIPANTLQRHAEEPLRGMVSSFGYGQSTYASSNGLTYQMLKNVLGI